MRIALIASLALCAAVPASAAQGLDCIVDAVPAPDAAALYVAFRTNAPPAAGVNDGMRSALAACRTTHGWTEPQLSIVREYTISRLFLREMRRTGPLSAEQLAVIDAVLATIDIATKRGWVSGGFTDDQGAALLTRLRAAGADISAADENFTGELVAAIAGIDVAIDAFARA